MCHRLTAMYVLATLFVLWALSVCFTLSRQQYGIDKDHLTSAQWLPMATLLSIALLGYAAATYSTHEHPQTYFGLGALLVILLTGSVYTRQRLSRTVPFVPVLFCS